MVGDLGLALLINAHPETERLVPSLKAESSDHVQHIAMIPKAFSTAVLADMIR